MGASGTHRARPHKTQSAGRRGGCAARRGGDLQDELPVLGLARHVDKVELLQVLLEHARSVHRFDIQVHIWCAARVRVRAHATAMPIKAKVSAGDGPGRGAHARGRRWARGRAGAGTHSSS